MKKKIIIIVFAIFIVILAFPLGFIVNYEIKEHRNKADLGKVETLYTTDETYSKISNIPYDEYVKECSFTENPLHLLLMKVQRARKTVKSLMKPSKNFQAKTAEQL